MASREQRCANRDDHRWSFAMARLYVRRTEEGKRKWTPIGWYCDPESKSWGDKGCGAITFDSDQEAEQG
jgi:hypothetical protein